MKDLKKINNAIEFIECNLTNPINISDIAKIAYCSTYNFQRMFSFLTDIPLSEYIRNRRLSLAALDLMSTRMKVNAVSEKYCYTSPTAFTRAFTAFHGITPQEAKQNGATLRSYPKMSFSMTIKGGLPLEFRIESKEGFDIFGIEIIASTKNNEIFEAPSGLWYSCLHNGELNKLIDISEKQIPGFPTLSKKAYGIINHRYIDDEHFSYILCAYDNGQTNIGHYSRAHIPSQTYAVFKTAEIEIGNPESAPPRIQEIQGRFYGEWLPSSGYEKTNGPEIEVYFESSDLSGHGYTELWFPVNIL